MTVPPDEDDGQASHLPTGSGAFGTLHRGAPRRPDPRPGGPDGADGLDDPAGMLVGAQVRAARVIPEATVARLAVYLRVLTELGAAATSPVTVSSEELAAAAGVNSAKLRKDLSYIGSHGTRGVGYDVALLTDGIEQTLGLTHSHSVAVVGIGNLGHALAGYGGFASRGFPVTALFDIDPDLVGIRIAGIQVHHVDEIPVVCAEHGVTIGVVATPGAGAQVACDLLVAGGVRCILNFAPVVLQVPDHVEVRKVDLAVELQILSFHEARRPVARSAADLATPAPPGGPGHRPSGGPRTARLTGRAVVGK